MSGVGNEKQKVRDSLYMKVLKKKLRELRSKGNLKADKTLYRKQELKDDIFKYIVINPVDDKLELKMNSTNTISCSELEKELNKIIIYKYQSKLK